MQINLLCLSKIYFYSNYTLLLQKNYFNCFLSIFFVLKSKMHYVKIQCT